jgi:threonylcarbamoyladenosine tRNA methylthiotransferase MtaB
MRVAFTTLGCRLNQFETEGMRQRVRGAAYETVDFDAAADVYVINSCTVTARAEQKCRQIARAVRRRQPSARVVVAGCYAQLSGERLMASGEIDAVLGNEEKRSLESYVERIAGGEAVAEVGRYRRGIAMASEWISDFGEMSRATIKVQEGCDLRCSFCTIWTARGPSRSRDPREMVEQAQRLAEAGYEEIVLAGVHLGHYGLDLERPTDLGQLLEMLLELVDERVRFRLSSIDPGEVDLDLVRLLVNDPRLCRYLHLPLQSGSETVLGRMRRAYTAKSYRDLVVEIAKIDPRFGLGVDVIVGFPGETDEEFDETYDLLADLPVSFYHVFRYSDRDGTPAARMGDKVPGNVSADRSERLRGLGREKKRAFISRHVGREVEGVVESGDSHTGLSEAMLDDYATVHVPGVADLHRKRIRIQVERIDDRNRLYGNAVGTSEMVGS